MRDFEIHQAGSKALDVTETINIRILLLDVRLIEGLTSAPDIQDSHWFYTRFCCTIVRSLRQGVIDSRNLPRCCSSRMLTISTSSFRLRCIVAVFWPCDSKSFVFRCGSVASTCGQKRWRFGHHAYCEPEDIRELSHARVITSRAFESGTKEDSTPDSGRLNDCLD